VRAIDDRCRAEQGGRCSCIAKNSNANLVKAVGSGGGGGGRAGGGASAESNLPPA
jgi:hypothetical protein